MIVLYARVSTDEQADHGYSLETQLDNCREYAISLGYSDPIEIQDDESGKTLDRPGLIKLMRMVDNNQINAVIVNSADRLSRSVSQGIILREEFVRKNVKLHYVSTGEYEDTPTGRFFDNIGRSMFEFEADLIVERTKRGKRRKAENGFVVGNGSIPYGYNRIGSSKDIQLVINEEQAAIIKIIFNLYNSGVSSSRIAQELNDKGILTQRNTKWSRSKILRVIKNECYTGVFHNYRWKITNGKQEIRPRNEWISFNIPVIIDEQTYQKAQIMKDENFSKSKRAKYTFLLSGMVYCQCGRHAVGTSRVSHYPLRSTIYGYYACSTKGHTEEHCETPYFPSGIDNMVWEFITSILLDEETMRQGLATKEMVWNTQHKDLLDEIKQLQKKSEKITVMQEQLLGDSLRGSFPQHIIQKKADQLQRELRDTLGEIETLKKQIIKNKTTNFSLEDLRGRLNSETKTKRDVLKKIQCKVTLLSNHEKQIEVSTLIGDTVIDIPKRLKRTC